MRFWSVLVETIYWAVSGLLLVLFILLKFTGTVLFDCNTMYNSIVHRIHGYCYCSLLLILFTVYTITVGCYTVPLVSLSRPGILSDMILSVLNELNNNEQLTLGLNKLMEETTSVFWVDLGYRLRSRFTVPLQDFGGWLTSRIVHIIIVINILLLLLTT